MINISDDGSRLHRMNIVRIEEDASLFQVSVITHYKRIVVVGNFISWQKDLQRTATNMPTIINVNSGPSMLSSRHCWGSIIHVNKTAFNISSGSWFEAELIPCTVDALRGTIFNHCSPKASNSLKINDTFN